MTLSRSVRQGSAQFAFDRKTKAGEEFQRTRNAEKQFGVKLRKIASHIADIVRGFGGESLEAAAHIETALQRYAQAIEPWARAVASRMIADVSSRDEKAWMQAARKMGFSLRKEIAEAPTGVRMQQLLNEQVGYITSLPNEAAERVHKLTVEGITRGARASEIAEEIGRTGEVTKARANLIARTEVGRTASVLTQARAEHIGSTGYIWRTAGDSDVRPSHKRMEGKFVAWNDPPDLDGMTGHAGALPNCRCYAEPVIPEE